jgi:hypothetical protein
MRPRGVVNLGDGPADVLAYGRALLVGDDQSIAVDAHADAQTVAEYQIDHAQVLGHDASDADLAGRHRAQPDVTPDLNIIGRDGILSSAKPVHPPDDQGVTAAAFDVGAQDAQQVAEVLHVRLRCGVAQDRRPFGQDGGHHSIFGGRHAHLVQQDVAPAQVGGRHGETMMIELDLRPSPSIASRCASTRRVR